MTTTLPIALKKKKYIYIRREKKKKDPLYLQIRVEVGVPRGGEEALRRGDPPIPHRPPPPLVPFPQQVQLGPGEHPRKALRDGVGFLGVIFFLLLLFIYLTLIYFFFFWEA